MNALVVYDSNFGNTKIVAETIAAAFMPQAMLAAVGEVTPDAVAAADFIVVGSPINGWRPTAKTSAWLQSLPAGILQGKKAAAFDTRIKGFLSGNAANRIAQELRRAGAEIVVDPEGFIVTGKEGPLAAGELERVTAWTKTLIA